MLECLVEKILTLQKMCIYTLDNVQTPIAHGKINYGGGFEDKGPLLNLRFKTMDEAWDCFRIMPNNQGLEFRRTLLIIIVRVL